VGMSQKQMHRETSIFGQNGIRRIGSRRNGLDWYCVRRDRHDSGPEVAIENERTPQADALPPSFFGRRQFLDRVEPGGPR